MKDWVGNKTSVFNTIGARNCAVGERENNDYYATDPRAVSALLEVKKLQGCIYECACGAGHLSRELESAGYTVYSSDLIDRGYGMSGVDFLALKQLPDGCQTILTNPPYKYSTQFISHSLHLLPNGGEAIFLLNITSLAGKLRFREFYSQGKLKEVYVFSGRIICAKNADFIAATSGAVNYAWFVFSNTERNSPTKIYWL
ncbi:MAG: hypothetical protein ACI3Z8_04790 [Paludibacteraceae bacterium]